jgi:glucokinase
MTVAIGCDLGGTHFSAAAVQDSSLLAVRDVSVESKQGLAAILPLIQSTFLELLHTSSVKLSDCLGLALSLPSLVDFYGGRIASTNDKYADALSVDLRGWCRNCLGLPLAIENDARAALRGEHLCGAAAGYSDVLLLTIGTGIGSAFLIDEHPFRTRCLQGGNLGGHIPVSIHGRKCTCGAFGCMEAEASSWSLPAIVADWPGVNESALKGLPSVNFKELFRCADAGDAVAHQILDHCIHVWAVGTVGLVHAYGPERIVFGGSVMSRADRILPQIDAYVNQHAWTPSGPVSIVPAALGNHAALYGAIPILQEFLLRGEQRAVELR